MASRKLAGWTRADFPILGYLENYRRVWLLKDLTARSAIAAVALPIGVTYPTIAGLPPLVGLYASILPLAMRSSDPAPACRWCGCRNTDHRRGIALAIIDRIRASKGSLFRPLSRLPSDHVP